MVLPANRDTFYTQDQEKGYTDYPFLNEEADSDNA